MLADSERYLQTFRYLKPIQVLTRGRNVLREKAKIRVLPDRSQSVLTPGSLRIVAPIPALLCYENGFFRFLNKEHQFDGMPDWNFNGFGKLWTYHLNYFDFLLQPGMEIETAKRLMVDFCNKMNQTRDGLEPYPTSLRSINWLKFIILNHIDEELIFTSLYAQLALLTKKLEYHLLGNHLLENGFALFCGGVFFRDQAMITVAERILTTELDEQVFPDGGHAERSPMYHRILLCRLLDCINFARGSDVPYPISLKMVESASRMAGWMETFAYPDGSFPLFHDSAHGMAPSIKEIAGYLNRLDIQPMRLPPGESRFRKMMTGRIALMMDIGSIGLQYQPGHIHAGIFSFELRINDQQFITDTGISTYEIGKQRELERSTAAHNTVEVGGRDQIQVWASHRVGKRAHVRILSDSHDEINAVHDGYRSMGIHHYRSFQHSGSDSVFIQDSLKGPGNPEGIARFHFAPGITFIKGNEHVTVSNGSVISFTNATSIEEKEYLFAPEFNMLIPAIMIEVRFVKQLNTIIRA